MVPTRRRAKQACIACNLRRVKCNVAEQQPCRNCASTASPCEVRESRRGKHRRKPGQAHSSITENQYPGGDIAATGTQTPVQLRQHLDEVSASQVLATLAGNKISIDVAVGDRDTEASEDAYLDSPPGENDQDMLAESRTVPGLRGSAVDTTQDLNQATQGPKASEDIPEWETERRRAKLRFLDTSQAFTFPSKEILHALLQVYFQRFHACFAVVNEQDVWTDLSNGSMSPLLLNAMLFIAVVHCNDEQLAKLDLGPRDRAKFILYTRAKDLYDADMEKQKLIVIQALFLLSFRRAGPFLQKDARHWLGVAISLAQTKALHRSSRTADSRPGQLRRRLWWSLYVRERQCAAALGLPHRIHDEDCDVKSPHQDDFKDAFGAQVAEHLSSQYINYQIGMVQLSLILDQVIRKGYVPGKVINDNHKAEIKARLIDWKKHLPENMQLEPNEGNPPSLQAAMLHMAANNIVILLYRPDFVEVDGTLQTNDTAFALQAATRNARILEDVLPREDFHHAQIHTITNLFNSLCIHTLQLRQARGIPRTIADNHAKLCLMGLKRLQATWGFQNYILQMFFQYLDRSTAAKLLRQGSSDAVIHDVAITSAGDTIGYTHEDQQGQFDPYPQHGDIAGPDTSAYVPWVGNIDEQNQILFSHIEQNFSLVDVEDSSQTTDAGFDEFLASWAEPWQQGQR